jgi:hypothetical protein
MEKEGLRVNQQTSLEVVKSWLEPLDCDVQLEEIENKKKTKIRRKESRRKWMSLYRSR